VHFVTNRLAALISGLWFLTKSGCAKVEHKAVHFIAGAQAITVACIGLSVAMVMVSARGRIPGMLTGIANACCLYDPLT
jgi:hypothetical protein